MKFAKHRNHRTFLLRCKNNYIIPKGLRLKTPVKSKKAYRVIQITLLRKRIGDIRRKKEWHARLIKGRSYTGKRHTYFVKPAKRERETSY